MYPILCVSAAMQDPNKKCKISKTIIMKDSFFYERLKSTFKYIYSDINQPITKLQPNDILELEWLLRN
jgi:hypothetical protein